MKKALLILALAGLPIIASAGDFEITVERKKDGLGQVKGTIEQSASQTWIGNVKVLNRSFKPSPEMECRYIIFIRRQELAQKAGADYFDKVKGSGKVMALKPGDNGSFLTSEVKLRQQRLDPGYYYTNGGSSRADDSVQGVWVKLFNGTTEIGEYVNPPTLKTKYKWE